jgi:type II secretory pathway pseudopilin PulG
MVPGFNHNFVYKGTLYHVQTEDGGRQRPTIVTLLFSGGTVLASRTIAYADILRFELLEQVVVSLMKEQHQGMLRSLKQGEFDEAIARARGDAPAAQRGTVLLTLLFMVVLLGLSAGLAGQALKDYVQREREEELLWRGLQYRQAIASYVNAKGAASPFPAKLEDLLKDPRSPGVVKHLRRLYDDPMTGQPWEPVKDANNRISGVRSTSPLRPFRQKNFPEGMEDFEDKNSYQEWQFVYVPPKKKAGQSTPGKTTTPRRRSQPVEEE